MKSIQMTIDEPLLKRMDEAARQLKLARSAFMRAAVERWLDELRERELDRQHREGYERTPLTDEERADFAAMQKLQDWGEPWEPETR